jgi:hypothetical protein
MLTYVQHDYENTHSHSKPGWCDNCKIVGPVFEGLAANHAGDIDGAYICSTCAETVVHTCIGCDQPSVCNDFCTECATEWLADNPEDIELWLEDNDHFAVVARRVLEAA